MGVRVRVGFKDSVGVQSGQKFPLGGFGAHGESGAFGAHGLVRAAPLATNCWPEAPRGGGGAGPTESPPPPPMPPAQTFFPHPLIQRTPCNSNRKSTKMAETTPLAGLTRALFAHTVVGHYRRETGLWQKECGMGCGTVLKCALGREQARGCRNQISDDQHNPDRMLHPIRSATFYLFARQLDKGCCSFLSSLCTIVSAVP